MRRLAASLVLLALTACSAVGQAEPRTNSPGVVVAPPDSTIAEPTTAPSVPPTSEQTTSTTPAATSTTAPTTTSSTSTTAIPATTATPPTTATTTVTTTPTLPPPISMPTLDRVVDQLSGGNLAVSVSVWRDGWPMHQIARGVRVDGLPASTATPFVQASVSKVMTALTVVRLARQDLIDLDAPPPWNDMGLAHHPDWDTVTVRELMRHESGMPIAPDAWFDQRGSCALALTPLIAAPPTARRGEWTYSNGNYCALGLLIEHATGDRYDQVTHRLVLAPAFALGSHITVDGLRSDDAPYPLGVERLDRLGAAGQWIMSTNDVASVLSTVTRRDLRQMSGPVIFRDLTGWGHTGTVDGAKSCAWSLADDRTVIVATVAGQRPARGSWLCAEILPAALADLTADAAPTR